MNKKQREKHLCCLLLSMLLFLTAVSCRNNQYQDFDYKGTNLQGSYKTAYFQYTINSTEEIAPNNFNTVLTQISGIAEIEYQTEQRIFHLESLSVKITAGEVDFLYDSSVNYTEEKDRIRNIPYSVLLNKSLVLPLDKDGYIKQIVGYEKIEQDLTAQINQCGWDTADQLQNTFYEFFSEDTLKFVLGRMVGGIPFETIQKGTLIARPSENVTLYGCDISAIFQYKGIRDNIYEFDISGTNRAAGSYNGISYDLSGDLSGKILLYESSGTGSLFREGHEQNTINGTQRYRENGEEILRNLIVSFNFRYQILNQ